MLLVAFGFVERRAAEPVLPLWVLGHRVLNSANSSALLVGVLMIGLSTYVPLYAQGVLGTSALVAGFALAAMTLGWPIAASLAGRLYLRLGFRTTMVIGSVFVVIGAGLLLTVQPSSSVVYLGLRLLRDRDRPRLLRVTRRWWRRSRRSTGGAVGW